MSADAIIGHLKDTVQSAMRDTYSIMDNFRVHRSWNLKMLALRR